MNYTHYGNAGIPFALVKEYNSYAAMVADFKSGELCTDVRYGEYVIISNDDPENIDFIHNGSIYRRGYNYWDEETGGAIFISNISESQNKVTQEAIEATKEAQSATKEMNDLYSEVKTSETDRVEKEAARVKAENIRSFAEQQRQSNEVNRQQTIATWDEAIDDLPSYHKRMYNLEDNTLEKEVVASDSMINEVPAEKMTYCSIEEIGGMSHKSENLIPFPYAEMTKTVNGITFTANEDGSITFSGKLTGNAAETNFFLTNPSTPLTFPNGVYTISQKLTTSDMHVLFALVNKITGDTTYHVAGTFELTDDLGLWVCVQSDGSASNVSGTIYPMLNRGETALPYEPYFEGLRGTKVTEVQSVGVNLIDDATGVLGYRLDSEGNPFREDGYVLFDYIEVEPNTSYCRSVYIYITAPVCLYDANKNFIVRLIDGQNTFTTTANTRYIRTAIEIERRENLMLNKGETALPYTPYFKETLSIPAGVQALEGYGQGINEEYYNKLILDPKNNIKKFVQKTKRVVFDGTEAWENNSTLASGVKRFKLSLPNIKNLNTVYDVPFAIATHYTVVDPYSTVEPDKNNKVIAIGDTGDQSMINVLDTDFATVTEFKTYLAEQYAAGTPVMIEYVLALPIETDLSVYFTDDNMLKTEEGGTLTFVNEYNYDVLNKVAYYETTLLNNEDILNERGNRLDKTISQDLFTNTIVNQEVDIEINNKNIKNNIEALNNNLIYSEIDEGDEYIKDVPDDVLPYAGITEIGGMTYKSNNLLDMTKFANNNITVTENSDGSFTFTNIHPNGAASASYSLKGKLPAGTYTVTNYSAKNFFICFTSGDYSINLVNGRSHTFTYDGESYLTMIFSDFKLNETAIVKVILNRGETVLPYEPYFEGLRDSKVTAVESVGVNLFDRNNLIQRTYIDLSNGELVEENKDGWYCTELIKVKDNVTISGIVNTNNGAVRYRTLDTNGNVINVVDIGLFNTKTIALTSNEKYLQVCIRSNNLETFNINHGTTIKNYSRGFRNTFPIPEAVQNLDGYGQGVNEDYYNKVVLNPAKGVKKFVKQARCVDLGDLSYEYVTSEEAPYFRARIDDIHIHANNALKCDRYTMHFAATNLMVDKAIRGGNGYPLIFIKDNDYTNANELKASLKGAKLVYPLAVPTEIDISEYFTDDNLIGIEADGTITAINEYNYDVPFTVEYKKKKENVSIENITHELGEEEKKVPSQKLFTNTARDLDDKITQNSINIEINNKRLQNLEAVLIGDTIEPVIDDTVAYVKDVPSNALPYASINEIGGMNYKCENLLSMSVLDNKTISGVTFTKNADGTYTANGTATEYIQVYFGAAAVDNTQKIWLSGGAHHVQITVNAMLGSTFVQNIGTVQGGTIQLSQNLNYDRIEFYLVMAPGVTCANVTFYGMANKGETALPYQPYFAGLRDSKVTAVESVGANLIPFPYAHKGTSTSYGVTATVNDDGSVTVKGTNRLDTVHNPVYLISLDAPIVLTKGTYSISGAKNIDTSSVRIVTSVMRLEDEINSYITGGGTFTVTTTAKIWMVVQVTANAVIDTPVTIYPMLNKGNTALPYSPYFKNTFSIPEAVQNLDGYGQGVPNTTHYNKVILNPAEDVFQFIRDSYTAVIDGSKGSLAASYANTFAVQVAEVANVRTCYGGNATVPTITVGNIGVLEGIYLNYSNAFYITDKRFTDETIAKAILAANPVYVSFYTLPELVTETDISEYFTDDNLIGVEANGTITAVNEYEHDVPATFEYLTKGATT